MNDLQPGQSTNTSNASAVAPTGPQKCSACRIQLGRASFLQCYRCPDRYHPSCLNFTKQEFSKFPKEFKESWVCPSCRCKEPKIGDNSNTPIRNISAHKIDKVTSEVRALPSQPAPVPASDYDNVTLRARSRSNCNCTCISAASIRDIIREELDKKFNDHLKDIQLKLTSFEESLSACCTQNDLLCQENEAQKAVISVLQKDNAGLRAATGDLTRRLHQLELLSRSNNIEVQCVPENKSENIYNTIQQLGSIIKCPIADSDLQYCSRIAKLDNQASRPRSILVRFSSRRLRDNFLASVTKFNRNNPKEKLNSSHLGIGGQKKCPVYVSEHLTPEIKSLHAAARLAARNLSYKFVWVRDGKVFVRKSETSGYVHVRNEDTLKSLN